MVKMSNRFGLNVINEARKAGEEDEKMARELSTQVQEAVAFLETAKGESRATKERIKTQIQEAKEFLTTNRLNTNPTIRRSVWKALINFTLNMQAAGQREVEEIISRLVADGLLEENPNGTLLVYERGYIVSPDSLFENEDVAEIKAEVDALIMRARKALWQAASLTVKDLLAGKEGCIHLFIPPEKFGPKQNVRWRPGGTLILETQAGFIKPLDATGKIETAVSQAKELGAKLSVNSLQANIPPFIKGENEEKNGKTQLLWYLVKRGMRFDEWLKKAVTRMTISDKEFLSDKEPGVCLLDFQEAWKTTNPNGNGEELWLSRPVVLIERLKVNEKFFLRIIDIPIHLTDWLEKCRETYPEKEKFEEIPQPLQGFLKEMHRKVLKPVKAS